MFCSFRGFLVKSPEYFTYDMTSNLCRFNNNNHNHNHNNNNNNNNNNDNKTLVKNLMLKKISHAPESDEFSRQYVNLIGVVLQCHIGTG